MLMQGRPSHGSYSVIVYSTRAGTGRPTGVSYELGSTNKGKRGWSLCLRYAADASSRTTYNPLGEKIK